MDYDVILKNANAMCRYAKTQDSRLPGVIKNFYQEGIKSPGVAKHLLNISYGKYMFQEFKQLKDPMTVYVKRPSDIFNQLKDLMEIRTRIKENVNYDSNLKTLKVFFQKKFNSLYPRSGAIRQKILNEQLKTIIKSA